MTVESAPARADRRRLERPFDAFNRPYLGEPPRRFAIFLRDAHGRIRAGLDALVWAGWLYIDNLWVDAEFRRRGLGHRLMARAEREARRRGCHSAWTDTFSFQAPEFYRRLGYRAFATLAVAARQRRIFLRKRLG